MRNTPILVLGATMTGIAMALALPDQVLILERTMLLGSEFIDSLNIKRCCPDSLKSTLAIDFKDELIRRNLLNNHGELHAPRISSVLAGRITQRHVNVMLLTEVVSIKSHPEGFEVVLHNADGITSVTAGQIIDTTSEGAFNYTNTPSLFKKSLCAMLDTSNIKSAICVPEGDDFATVLKGRFESEYVLKLALDNGVSFKASEYAENDWVDARASLNNYWQKNRLGYLAGCRIASIASSFAYDLNIANVDHFTYEVCDKWKWIPSSGYSNMLSAFEGGAVCAAII